MVVSQCRIFEACSTITKEEQGTRHTQYDILAGSSLLIDMNEDKLSLNQEHLNHTQNSKLKFTFSKKKKVDVTLHSSKVTDHSFTFVQLM